MGGTVIAMGCRLEGRTPTFTFRDFNWSFRATTTDTSSSGFVPRTAATRSSASCIFFPLNSVMRSFSSMPAFSAGLSSTTPCTSAPAVVFMFMSRAISEVTSPVETPSHPLPPEVSEEAAGARLWDPDCASRTDIPVTARTPMSTTIFTIEFMPAPRCVKS